MKKTILLIFILIPMMFCLCGCGEKEIIVDTNNGENVEDVSEELEINGTGEIKLKEFIESPKVLDKTWTEVTINDVKTTYNVNENKESNTIHLTGGEELWISYSGKENYVEIEKDGVSEKIYTENVTIRDMIGSSLRVSSEDIIYDGPVPEKLEIGYLDFEMQTNLPDMDESIKKNILDEAVRFYPYIKENNCDSLEDILNALGMNETDKTVYEAIKNNVEYYADYTCEYGEVELVCYSEETGATIAFEFQDENCEYDMVSIAEHTDKTEEGEYSFIEIIIRKNYN